MDGNSYRQDLGKKLEAARKRVRQGREFQALKVSAPSLFEVIDSEISMEVNRGYNDGSPLSYDDYLESHGAVRGLRRVRNLIDSKEAEAEVSAQEVEGIKETLKQFDNDQKH